MDINVYLFIVIALMLLIIMYLLFVLRRVRTQLALIKDALEDIKGGNLNRRILAGENDMTKTICYDINKIAVNSQAQLIRQRQSEQAYKRLMTSLSHDVKTPLASLVGYLEAVENKKQKFVQTFNFQSRRSGITSGRIVDRTRIIAGIVRADIEKH